MSRARAALLLSWLSICTLPGVAAAERLAITSYSTGEGLAGAYVSAVLRDSRGFVWVGTRDGVSRFDGVRFVNYGVEDGLSDPTVNDVIESRAGDHWMATNGGGACQLAANAPPPGGSRRLFACLRVGESGYTNRVNSLFEDARGRLWAATDGGLFRLALPSTTPGTAPVFVALPLDIPGAQTRMPPVSRIVADGEGGVWIGTTIGLVHLDAEDRPRYGLPGVALSRDTVAALLRDASGRLWLGGHGIVVMVSPDRPDERTVIPLGEPHQHTLARRLYQTSDGHIWIGTTKGLIHVTAVGARSEDVRMRTYTTAHGLTSDFINAIVEDQDGNVWLGGNAAMKLTRRGFVTYTTDDGLGDPAVHGIFETKTGQLCVVSGDWIINGLAADRFDAVRTRVPEDALRHWGSQVAVLDRLDQWWLLAVHGLWRLAPATRLADLAGPLPPPFSAALTNAPIKLLEDRAGFVWIAFTSTTTPLLRWDRSTGRARAFGAADGLPADSPSALGEDPSGRIWVGFRSAGLARLDGERFTLFSEAQHVPSGSVSALYTDDLARFWIGTTSGGLARVDDVRAPVPAFTPITMADGLSSNNIRCLISDTFGRLYAGTARGVDRYDPATGHVRRYTTRDGLADGLATAAYRDRRGTLWFGTSHGLSRLDPIADPSRVPPPVWIGAVRLAGVVQPSSHLGASDVAPVTLAPGQNQLDVEFFGLTFAMGDTLRYQYQLEGADHEWSPATSEQRVHYSALAPGHYRFLVRAVTADGLVSTRPATAAFTVLPPLWQRGWFRLAMLGLVGLLVTMAYRARVARLLELERVRTRIASDLHDDIGSSLSRMAILSEVAKRQLGDAAPEPARHLTDIADTARTLIDAMSDIVWSIDPRHDDLGSVVVRVREFAADLLAARDVKWSCTAPPDLDRIRLRPDARRHLLLLLKEAVTNVARHAQATTARLTIELRGSTLVAELIDDGRGFVVLADPVPVARGGHGLSSMRWRAGELGATLQTVSAPGAGTRVHITVPLRPSQVAKSGPHAHAMPDGLELRQDQDA